MPLDYDLLLVPTGCRIDNGVSSMTTDLTSHSSPEEKLRRELIPEEAALVARIGVFIAMRWIAIAGILIASLLATQVLRITFPLLPIYIISACMALYNFVLFLQARGLTAEASGSVPQGLAEPLRRLIPTLNHIPKATSPLIEKARVIGNVHVVLDLAALTVLLHFTGGIENPFIFYFVFHVIIAGILLHYRVAYALSGLAILLVILLVGLEYNGVIPHVHLEGFASATLYRQGTYILGIIIALTTCLFGSTYMITHISGEQRRRQREVVILREHLLTEKTKELEEASKDLAKLKEGRRRLLHFLGIVAHDLKAPLAAVQSYLQLMLGGYSGKLAEKQRHMLERSSHRITELLGLISDLLDISRIEAGYIVQEMEEVSLVQVVQDSLENVRDPAEEKGIRLKVEMPKSLPQIRASGIRLKQTITNLVGNAIKFTPEKGVIKLRVTQQTEGLHVEVMDTGVGIAAEELPKIFDDFYRGVDTEKAGAGLGLSIVKRIVEAHGGKIWAESPNPEEKLQRGSKFTFTLPKSLVLNRREKGKQSLTRRKKA